MVALSPAEGERIAALEAQLKTLQEDRELAKKYDIRTPELLAFARDQERKARQQKLKQRLQYEHRKAEEARAGRVVRFLASSLLAAGALRIFVGREQRHPADIDQIGCPKCGSPSNNAAGYLLSMVERWNRAPDSFTLISSGPIGQTYPILGTSFNCEACKAPIALTVQPLVVADADDPRNSAEFRKLIADIEAERETAAADRSRQIAAVE